MHFPAVRENASQHDLTCFTSLVNTMDIDAPPNPEISFQTVLDTVSSQSQEIEANVDPKIS